MRNMSPSSGNMEATSRRLSSIQSLAAVTNVEPMHHRCVFALRESPASATLGANAVDVEAHGQTLNVSSQSLVALLHGERLLHHCREDQLGRCRIRSSKKIGTGDVAIAGLQSAVACPDVWRTAAPSLPRRPTLRDTWPTRRPRDCRTAVCVRTICKLDERSGWSAASSNQAVSRQVRSVRPLDAQQVLQVAPAPSPDHGKLSSLGAAQKNAEISC